MALARYALIGAHVTADTPKGNTARFLCTVIQKRDA